MATVTPIEIAIYSLSANGVLDDASPMYAYVKVPSIVSSVTECIVSLAFRQFSANAKDAASGGGATSSEKTLTLGLSSGATSISGTSGAASAGTAHTHSVGTYSGDMIDSPVISIDPHTHTVPAHTHALTYGTYEEAYPASHSVFMNIYKRVGSTWTLQGSKTAITSDLADLDLTSLITGPGDYQLRIKSDTAQPNNGRLGVDLYGSITAQIG